MPRRLPTLTLSLAALAVAVAVFRPAFGNDAGPTSPPAAAGARDAARVHVDPAGDAPPVEGTLKATEVTLETDTGRRTVYLKHVARVTFSHATEGKAQDTVELADKSIARGTVTADRFDLDTPSGPRTFGKAELREIRVIREPDLSLFGILIGLLTLSAMEIVLGIDNVIFLAIIAGKLPPEQRPKARRIGLAAALGTRLLLLFSLSFLLGLTNPVFTLPSLPLLSDLEAREVSWRDIILLAGGLFLIGKSTFEIHEKLEHAKKGEAAAGADAAPAGKPVSFAQTIFTIAVIDIVFSLDSVITAVGMVDVLWVMVVAMVIAMAVMLFFATYIANFVDQHPTIKVLALSFLILIGVLLVAEGLGQHIDKGYIYFAMAFAVGIEFVNMRLRGGRTPDPAAD